MSVAVWLRFRGLTIESYWLDEMATLYLAQPDHSLLQVLEKTLSDKTTPLYQLLTWSWFQAAGFSEFTGRSLPAVFGICAVAAMYFLAREYFNSRVALFAAAITCTNQYLIDYSREARSYELLFLLTALTLLFLSRMLRIGSRREYFIYTLLCVCLVQTHYYGILVYLVQTTLILLHGHLHGAGLTAAFRRYWLNPAVVIISLLPAMPYLYKNALKKEFWIETPPPDFLVDYFTLYFANGELALLFGFLCTAGLYCLFRPGDSGRKNILYLAALTLFFVYVLPYARSLLSTPMLIHKYTIGGLPVIILLACAGLNGITWRYFRPALAVLVVLYSLYVLLVENAYYHTIHKEQYREALGYIADRGSDRPVVYAYHIRGLKVYARLLGHNMEIRRSRASALEDLADGKGTFWLIVRDDTVHEWAPFLDREFRFVGEKNIKQIKNIRRHDVRLLLYEQSSG